MNQPKQKEPAMNTKYRNAKNLFLFAAACFLSFPAFLPEAEAKKKRYIKRMHGVKALADIVPYQKSGGTATGAFDLDLAYSYNWKGMIEVGPHFNVKGRHIGGFALEGLGVGIQTEYNFIKNKGKKRAVPALGLKLGANQISSAWHLSVAPYFSLKYFVAKRTPFIFSAGYDLNLNFQAIADFQQAIHSSFVQGGFAYYFDFY